MCVKGIKKIIKGVLGIFGWIKGIKKIIKGVLGIFGWILRCIISGLTDDKIIAHVIIAGMLGVFFGYIFYRYHLEMSKEAWFYVFSALSQTLAAFIAFGAMIFIFRLGNKNEKPERIELINELNIPYSLMITSIILSIILITFGQINTPSNWITNDWFKFLKYGISFFTISLGLLGMICAGKMIWESRHPPPIDKCGQFLNRYAPQHI